ncbi:MAG: PEP-CTERM sorting domain-containing protein [Thiobacillus sp.]
MNFKLNALVAAALLVAAGSANAAIDPGLNGNGEIFFAVYDSVAQKSFTFDSGVYMADFVGTGVNYNFDFSGDANWSTFTAGTDAANWLWMVGASGATGTIGAKVFTTDNAASVSIPKAGPTNMAANGKNFTNAQIASLDYAADISSVKYVGDAGYFGDSTMTGNWGTKFTPDASATVGTALNFFSITGAGGLGNVSGVKFGTAATDVWTLNATAGVLNYGVAAAVPEADTYAMMLAGLGLVGFMARRRKSI